MKRLGVAAALVDGQLVHGDVAFQDGQVAAIGLPAKGSRVAVAGLVDLQVNGYAGVDAASATVEQLHAMNVALAHDGILSYQPTLISDDPAAMCAALDRVTHLGNVDEAGSPGPEARVLGVHLEGPFLSPERAGAHPVSCLALPDPDLVEVLVSSGPVTMVTVAPELPGALELIDLLVRRGIVVSLGHSAATAEQANKAVNAGASAVTHLYNAMTPLSARGPGLAGHALVDPRVRLQLIADGVHVAAELLQLAFRAAPGRCSIVSDSTSFAGGGTRETHVGGMPVVLDERVARRPDGMIAGGASTLLDAVRYLASLPIPLPEILAAATELPARALGRDDVGHLRPGGPADAVVLSDDLELVEVFVHGGLVLDD